MSYKSVKPGKRLIVGFVDSSDGLIHHAQVRHRKGETYIKYQGRDVFFVHIGRAFTLPPPLYHPMSKKGRELRKAALQ